ncbi:GTP-binding protein GEM [Frankliniella fusca]|uniref:GTP-binding protein GEM n=1 Tax=Frankliniella fusca TaxID=407009 RepID=A0AAE1LPU2_9NEOP|nr:GTP-binding protein GEM [Frankliniella fusca]
MRFANNATPANSGCGIISKNAPKGCVRSANKDRAQRMGRVPDWTFKLNPRVDVVGRQGGGRRGDCSAREAGGEGRRRVRSSSVSPSPCHAAGPGGPGAAAVQRARSMRTPVRSPSDCSMGGPPRPRRARPRSHSRARDRPRRGTVAAPGGPPYYVFPSSGCSSSSEEEDESNEYYLLRNFAITGKGVVNRGDSVKSRRSSADSNDCPSPAERSRSPPVDYRVPPSHVHRVVILGAHGVGKSSLVQQFSTSDFLHAYCASPDEDARERSVNVLLNGEESELSFLEQHDADVTCDYESEPHAFCVVFAATERSSFRLALDALERLWHSETVGTKAVILVANKTDLVRGRVVSTEEAKSAATQYDCKYIETSVAINHNVDELLVGLLTQIRLKLKDPEKSRSIFRKRSFSRRKSLGKDCANLEPTDIMSRSSSRPEGHIARKIYRGSKTSASFRMKSLLDKVLARDSKAKSCEKLHVL